jgi:hypothetical protein
VAQVAVPSTAIPPPPTNDDDLGTEAYWKTWSFEGSVIHPWKSSFCKRQERTTSLGTIVVNLSRMAEPSITYSYVSSVLKEDDNEQDRNDATA